MATQHFEDTKALFEGKLSLEIQQQPSVAEEVVLALGVFEEVVEAGVELHD